MTVEGIYNGEICGNEKAILRAVVPGIKAEDYEVNYLYFPNLIAFLMAKSFNESAGFTIFDYEKLFESSDAGIKSMMQLEFFGEDFSDEMYAKAVDTLKFGVMNLIEKALIPEAAGAIDQATAISLARNAQQYAINELARIKNQFCYTSEATLNELKENGDEDNFCSKISGICFAYPDKVLEHIDVRNIVLEKWFRLASMVMSDQTIMGNFNPAAPTVNPAVSMQIPIQVPVTAAQQPQANDSVNLVGWQDLQPGIIPTDSNDQQATGGNTYEELSPEERATVDSIVSGLQHLQDIQQNPHAFENEVNAANNILNQVTAGINQAVNNQSTGQHACTCGHDNCNCGNH